MQLTKSIFSGKSDLQAMINLMLAFPPDGLSAVALPYQLSSWATHAPDNIGLWRNTAGQLIGFAFFQIPFLTLFYSVHPSAPATFFESLLLWVVKRGQDIANIHAQPFNLFIWVGKNQVHLIPVLENQGFSRTKKAKVHLDRPLTDLFDIPALPQGFTLRHLSGQSEAAEAAKLLRRAFDLTTFTLGWRQRIMKMPQYDPELDIVVIAPDGQQAAFCLCWLHPDGSVGQVEPMGTHPNYQRLGLGRAVLLEGLRRMQLKGATTAIVGTSFDNYASHRLYQSTGFSVQKQLSGYQQTFLPSNI